MDKSLILQRRSFLRDCSDGHLHFLTDWLLGPDPEENEEEEEEATGAGERKNKQEEKHRSSSRDQNNPGFKLSTIS